MSSTANGARPKDEACPSTYSLPSAVRFGCTKPSTGSGLVTSDHSERASSGRRGVTVGATPNCTAVAWSGFKFVEGLCNLVVQRGIFENCSRDGLITENLSLGEFQAPAAITLTPFASRRTTRHGPPVPKHLTLNGGIIGGQEVNTEACSRVVLASCYWRLTQIFLRHFVPRWQEREGACFRSAGPLRLSAFMTALDRPAGSQASRWYP
jgi:hypothetical protein